MWWPDTREQPIEDLKRYDWIGFGRWDKISTIEQLNTVNPDQKHFMDYSITETSWSSWENNRIIMQKIPSEWFLTQRGFVRTANPHQERVRIAPQITFWPTTWVMNMSSLCPKVDVNDGNSPQNWIEFACRNKKIENEDLWDGYITDRIEETQSWLIPKSCRSIDPDCSNKEVTDDYTAFDAAWYEGFPTNWDNSRPETYEEWSYRALGEKGYLNVSISGYSPNYSLGETY